MNKSFSFKTSGSVAATFVLFGLSPLSAVLIQDFEADTSGVTEIPFNQQEIDNSVTDIVKRTDGTDFNSPAQPNDDFLGISPSGSGGSWYGEIRSSYEDGDGNFFVLQGDRAKWNDGAQTGGFQSGYGHSIDIYLDDLSFYGASDGFFFQPTLLDDTNSNAVSGGGFGVRVIDTGGGALVWRVGADGDTKGFSGITGSTFDTASTGWYTMETIWQDDGLGNIDQVNTLYDINGNVELSVTLEDVLLVGDAGQLGAASFGNGDEDNTTSLATAYAVDNLQIVPEPSAFALIAGLSLLAFTVIARRR